MSVSCNEMRSKSDAQLDLSGFNCPMPLLKTKQQLNKMTAGGALFVMTTDQGSVRDFKSYLDMSKHRLLAAQQDNDRGEYYFLIECG